MPSATIGRQPRIDVADDDRREPEADLVAQQEVRVRHQRAADGDHLLLAAGERRAGLVAALGQHREQLVDALQAPRPGPPQLAADQQVLLDRQRGKQPPAFRHQRDAARHDVMRGQVADRLAVEDDGVAARRASAPAMHLSSVDLAGAVGADHGDHLACGDAPSRRRTAPGSRRRRRRARAPRAAAQASASIPI